MLTKVDVADNIIQLFMGEANGGQPVEPRSVKLLKDQLDDKDREIFENSRKIVLDYFKSSADKRPDQPKRFTYDPNAGLKPK
jgi:hypothetical protein